MSIIRALGLVLCVAVALGMADVAASIPLTVHAADIQYLAVAVAPVVLPGAYTIPEYCRAYRISRSLLYKEWRAGRGPRWILFGVARRITYEAAAEYARENERTSKHAASTQTAA